MMTRCTVVLGWTVFTSLMGVSSSAIESASLAGQTLPVVGVARGWHHGPRDCIGAKSQRCCHQGDFLLLEYS